MRLPEKRKYQNNSKEVREFSFEKNYKLVYLTVISFFLGNFICVNLGFRTLIPLFTFVKIVFFVIILAWVVQHYFFKSIFLMKSMEYLMLATFGIAPLVMSLFLGLNYFIHLEENTKIYRIDRSMDDGRNQYFEVKGIPCAAYPELCIVHKDDLKLKVGEFVEITLAKGLFGFETITEIKSAVK